MLITIQKHKNEEMSQLCIVPEVNIDEYFHFVINAYMIHFQKFSVLTKIRLDFEVSDDDFEVSDNEEPIPTVTKKRKRNGKSKLGF